MRIMGIDPGDRRIGIAISDETGMIANPVGVVEHISRHANAVEILRQAELLSAEKIIIGLAYDEDGTPSLSGRKSIRLGDEIKSISQIQVVYVDEYGSTNLAQQTAREMGIKRSARQGHRDEIAAVVILQTYLDQIRPESL